MGSGAIVESGTVQRTRYGPPLRALDSVGTALLGDSARRPISMQEIRRAAERKIGFSDWGMTPEFERAAELLEKDMVDRPAPFIGRFLLKDALRRHHENRLRIRRAIAEAPSSGGFDKPPYIITGLYRTGTTLMHQLLAAVPGRDFVPAYELMCPVPADTREADARTAFKAALYLGPEAKIVHPSAWDQPEECWFLLGPTLRVPDFGVIFDMPSYLAWLDECTMREAYLEYRAMLEYLNSFRDAALVMKGPGHTPSIAALHRAIPEARIVFMHRDPPKAVASFCSLSAIHHRSYYGSFDADAVGQKVLERFAHFTRAAAEQRPSIPDASILDVYFHDLVDDPVATVRRISEHFGEPWSDDAEAAVTAKLEQLPRDKNGKHHYSAAQWGLTADGVRGQFTEYLREHDVRPEDC